MRDIWRPVLALVIAALVARPGAAQILGSVRDSVSGQPIRGAVVTLTPDAPAPVIRTLTNQAGAFRIPGASAGALRIIHIGHRPFQQRVERLTSEPLRVSMVPLGRNLPAVAVRSNTRCPANRTAREALALWSAASDGLYAILVGADSSAASGSITQLLYDRLLDDAGRNVVRQSVQVVRTGNTMPVRAGRTPAQLAANGYVVRSATGSTYYAPDAATLIDTTFAGTHCLTTRTGGRDRPGQVGVAFTPAQDRAEIPDIAGVLWLDQSPLALRALEFQYRGVDPAVIEARAGGTIEFTTLANGVPVIQSWTIRTPKLRYLPTGRRVEGRSVAEGEMAVIAELREAGGLIGEGHLGDGTHWSTPLATLGGRVLDSRSGVVTPSARITLDSTDYVATSDSSGQFAFHGVLPGPYTMRIADSVVMPRMLPDTGGGFFADTGILQVVHRTASIDLTASLGRVDPVDLRLPWGARVGGCFGYDEGVQRYVLIGQAMTADSSFLAEATVRLSWSDRDRDATIETAIEVRASADGRFWFCGLPADRVLDAIVVAQDGSRYAGTTSVPSVDYDEEGQKRKTNLRRVTLVVDKVTGSGGSP